MIKSKYRDAYGCNNPGFHFYIIRKFRFPSKVLQLNISFNINKIQSNAKAH